MTDAPADELPAEVKAFLFACIEAVEEIEILDLLARDSGEVTARAVSETLGLPHASARHYLEILTARGLLRVNIGAGVSYAYSPKSPDLQRYCDRLLEHYARSRTPILRLIAAGPRRSAKRFADAFKLRDPEK
jgi:DNA-binding transcriptional ArsR family regulator